MPALTQSQEPSSREHELVQIACPLYQLLPLATAVLKPLREQNPTLLHQEMFKYSPRTLPVWVCQMSTLIIGL